MQAERRAGRGWIKVAAPLLVLLAAVLATRAILGSRPTPEIGPETVVELPRVAAMPLAASAYRPVIRGRGTVRPTRQSALVSEIAGAVTALSDDFVTGGAFRAGDVLARIDERDGEIALTRARANLARADAQFEEQAALAEQAVLEWRQLGRQGEPSALTLQGAAARRRARRAGCGGRRARARRARSRTHSDRRALRRPGTGTGGRSRPVRRPRCAARPRARERRARGRGAARRPPVRAAGAAGRGSAGLPPS